MAHHTTRAETIEWSARSTRQYKSILEICLNPRITIPRLIEQLIELTDVLRTVC